MLAGELALAGVDGAIVGLDGFGRLWPWLPHASSGRSHQVAICLVACAVPPRRAWCLAGKN
jgi:hypothetical protein